MLINNYISDTKYLYVLFLLCSRNFPSKFIDPCAHSAATLTLEKSPLLVAVMNKLQPLVWLDVVVVNFKTMLVFG